MTSTAAHIASFCDLLESVIPATVSTDPYAVAYLEHLLAHKRYYLHVYAGLLDRLDRKPLIDYGSGNGLLGIFAKFCGFEKVALIDVDNAFLEASRVLAGQLKVSIDIYLEGQLRELEDAGYKTLVGTDVIEHIYDLGTFMRTARALDIEHLLLTTSANPLHYKKAREIRQVHLADEHEGNPASEQNRWVAVPAFIQQRYAILETALQGADPAEVGLLARITRGLKRTDIVTAAERYRKTGEWPEPPGHPTNTCDPETGSWSERLLSIREYKHYFAEGGYTLTVRNGGYNAYEATPKAVLLGGLNALIRLNRKLGHRLAAYLILEGRA